MTDWGVSRSRQKEWLRFRLVSPQRCLTLVLGPAFVRGSVEADEGKGVDVPHAVHAREEGARVLQLDVLIP